MEKSGLVRKGNKIMKYKCTSTVTLEVVVEIEAENDAEAKSELETMICYLDCSDEGIVCIDCDLHSVDVEDIEF